MFTSLQIAAAILGERTSGGHRGGAVHAITAGASSSSSLTPAKRLWRSRRCAAFAGSDRGGERAAAMYTLIVTAKLNGIDPQAWLTELLRRIADHPASRIDEFLPWHWKKPADQAVAA